MCNKGSLLGSLPDGIPAATVGGKGWFGNVLIIFADQNQNGIIRLTVIPDAGQRTVGTAITAADGTFALPKLPRVGPGSVPVSVYFDGGGIYRAITWTPLQQ